MCGILSTYLKKDFSIISMHKDLLGHKREVRKSLQNSKDLGIISSLMLLYVLMPMYMMKTTLNTQAPLLWVVRRSSKGRHYQVWFPWMERDFSSVFAVPVHEEVGGMSTSLFWNITQRVNLVERCLSSNNISHQGKFLPLHITRKEICINHTSFSSVSVIHPKLLQLLWKSLRSNDVSLLHGKKSLLSPLPTSWNRILWTVLACKKDCSCHSYCCGNKLCCEAIRRNVIVWERDEVITLSMMIGCKVGLSSISMLSTEFSKMPHWELEAPWLTTERKGEDKA